MPGLCCYCNANSVKYICGRCKSIYYCNSKCQRAHWKDHKLECITKIKQQIIFPKPPIVRINANSNDILSRHGMQNVNELQQIFDDTKPYNKIDLQFVPSNQIIQQLTKILLSPLVFWYIEELNIEFYIETCHFLDGTVINDLFYVISKLPKLTHIDIDDLAPRNNVSVQIKKKYFESFKTINVDTPYQSLTHLFIPIDDVFHEQFDYSAFLSFIETSEKLRSIEIKLVYWVNEQNKCDIINYKMAINKIFASILERARYGRSIEEFSFVIDDIDEPIDNIDQPFAHSLVNYLEMIVAKQRDLYSLSILYRPFTKILENRLWKFIENKCFRLTELNIDDRELRPNTKSLYKHDEILKMIAKQKYMEFIRFDGYILWKEDTLRNFVNVINNNCREIRFIRFGWIQLQSQNGWEILMEILKCNYNVSLLYFNGYQMESDAVNHETQSIICDAVIGNIRSFNEYMVKIEKILSFYFEGQKCVIQEMFKYLEDDELKSDVMIVISCVGVIEPSIQRSISLMATKITNHVNQQIGSIKHELSYCKNFKFEVI